MADTAHSLTAGDDSGAVPPNTKLQVFVKGFGRCAYPGCSQILILDSTKLGECCHIIPKVVGGTREDFTTPLEERKKEHNLIYLCEAHHKLVDDRQHEAFYTAEKLLEWKAAHEDWAMGVTKTSGFLAPDVRAKIASLEEQLAQHSNFSEMLARQMLDVCREFLNRNLVNEASVILSRTELYIGEGRGPLNVNVDWLKAVLLIRTEQVQEAKERLLEIVHANPDAIEPMIEYIELCTNAPEPDDSSENVERLARALNTAHPRLQLVNLARKFQKQEPIDVEDGRFVWTEDTALNSKFLAQYALFSDLAQDKSRRDELLSRWEQEQPTSPRPHLLRAHFARLDFIRSGKQSREEQTQALQEAFSFVEAERVKTAGKDRQPVRDQVSWLLQEIWLQLASFNLSGAEADADVLDELRGNLVLLIERCYFDVFINNILAELLSLIRVEPDQWRRLTQHIPNSKVRPSAPLMLALFFQAVRHQFLYHELEEFLSHYGDSELREILQLIRDDAPVQLAGRLETKNDPLFTLTLIQSIGDQGISAKLIELVSLPIELQSDWLYTQLRVFNLNKMPEKALDIVRKLPIDDASVGALELIVRFAFGNQLWDIFIPSALKLLSFDISARSKSHLQAELSFAYFELGDDTNAITYADQALKQSEELGTENCHTLLHILSQSYTRKGMADEACEAFERHKHIQLSFPLLLEEAELYLRSSLPDRYEKSLARIMLAFAEANPYTDELYISALMLLIELSNVGKISHENEPSVEAGLFIEIDGFPNGWFYVGEKANSLGAQCIEPQSANYSAVIHRKVGEQIEWPADRYSTHNKRRIQKIAKGPAFLAHRAHEVMQQMAQVGNAPIWSIQMQTKEDGSLDLENLKRFIEEQHQFNNEFFDMYIATPMPFSFLCASEGGVIQAISRIATTNKGFVRINDSTGMSINEHKKIASDVLRGETCYLDGLAALMLAEADLLNVVIKAVPNLSVSTSVVRLLRETAAELENNRGAMGRLAILDGNFRFNPKNPEQDKAFGRQLLESADLLDQLPNKVIGRTYQKSESDRSLDELVPNCISDAFWFAQASDTYLLTDDGLLGKAYELFGVSPIPKQFSSLSLIREMAENKLVTWDTYLRYFARLSFYRFHLLSISADDMFQTAFPTSPGGLVTSSPRSLNLLNLSLTLSQEYGVESMTAARVLSAFFTKIIRDEGIPAEIAEEVFALTITQSLHNRDKRQMSRLIKQICKQNVENIRWASSRTQQKLDVLNKQLLGYMNGVSPIIIDSPLLLRNTLQS